MNSPRIEVRLDLVEENARALVQRLAIRGITVTGVTKATLGSPEIAGAFLRGGVAALGESRIENVERLRNAGQSAPITMIRSPLISQANRVVASCETSLVTELDTIAALSAAATNQGLVHGITLMVELGDLREGILPTDLAPIAKVALSLPGLKIVGVGTNLACQSGVIPNADNMAELSTIADELERALDIRLDTVSGGNSANLGWALGIGEPGRINNLRLGESILLGRDPLTREPIAGLHLDAFTICAEVIESKVKPSVPWGATGQTAFGVPVSQLDRGITARVLVALGRQDTDPAGLTVEAGFALLGASSDHIVLDAGTDGPSIGSDVCFHPNYSALLGAMTSPFVGKLFQGADS